MQDKFTAVFVRGESGWIVGYVAELPGAHAQGRTLEEARANLRGTFGLVLEANRQITAENFAGATEIAREPLFND